MSISKKIEKSVVLCDNYSMEKEPAYSKTKNATRKRKNKRYRLRGLQLAAISLAMMALADFSVHVIRSFEKNYLVEFIYIGVTFVAWLLMFAGTRMIAEYEKNYKQAFYSALPALASCMVWTVTAVYYVQSGMGYQTFSSAGVMFMSYICFLCMLYSYTHVLNGSSAILEGYNKLNLQRKCRRVWKPCFVLIILSLICIQGAPMFSELIKYIITGAATLTTLIAEMIMIRYILAVYEQMDGERVHVMMDDLITRISNENVASDIIESINEPESESESAEKSIDDESVKDSDTAIYDPIIKINLEHKEQKEDETKEQKEEKSANADIGSEMEPDNCYNDEKTEELVEEPPDEDESAEDESALETAVEKEKQIEGEITEDESAGEAEDNTEERSEKDIIEDENEEKSDEQAEIDKENEEVSDPDADRTDELMPDDEDEEKGDE